MHILNNPHIWQFFRGLLEIFFGHYRKRISTIRSFGITDQMTVLDVGCGIGQYAILTKKKYLGIDMDKKYINLAKQTYKNNSLKKFLCEDLGKAKLSDAAFDVSLLVDFTHHLSNEELNHVFVELNRITSKYIVISDPVKQSDKNLIGRFLTYIDRGNYIRAENHLINLIGNYFRLLEVKKVRSMGIESVSVLACPKEI
ncbi:class I SAM-dependent methyltransferase [Bacteroidota bacterium]